MRKSVNLVKSLPAIPIYGDLAEPIFATYLEYRVENMPVNGLNISYILEEFGQEKSNENIQEILDFLENNEDYLNDLYSYFVDLSSYYKENDQPVEFIYKNVKEEKVQTLQDIHENFTKYERIDILKNVTFTIFNKHLRLLTVHNGKFNVRLNSDQDKYIYQLQDMILGASKCSCGNDPCTCGASLGFDQKKEDYSYFDKVYMKLNSSDSFNIFINGESVYESN